MITINEEQVLQAEADVEEAEGQRVAAERAYATGPSAGRNYQNHLDAVERAAHATARLNTLRADFEAQQAELGARSELLKAAAKEVAPAARKLAKSREAAVGALVEAREAVGKALQVLGEHDRLVQESARGLWDRGLRGEGGESTGGLLDGSLLVAGERWDPVDAPGLLFAVLTDCVKAAGLRHRLAAVPQTSFMGSGRQLGAREFLDRLAAKGG